MTAEFYLASDSQIETRVPSGATSGPIAVDNGLGIAASASSFTVLAPPTVQSFSPNSGQPGDSVVLQGSGFTGATAVLFGGQKDMAPGGDPVSAVFTVDSDVQITASVPLGGMTGPIYVQTPGGTAGSGAVFTVLSSAAPSITALTPTSGGQWTGVTITGTNFTGTTAVAFNGLPADWFSLQSDTQVFASVPPGATTGPVSVTNTLGTAVGPTFTIIPPPSIASFAPSSGAAGDTVVITGSGFTGATNVSLGDHKEPVSGGGGEAAGSMTFTVDSDTQITATVPAGAQTGPLSVTTPGGSATSSVSFVVLSSVAPTIDGFSPSSDGVGRSVTVIGSGFTGTTSVEFNGTIANFSLVSDSEIQTWVPEQATSGAISVTNTLGTATSSSSFTVIPPPSITSFSPPSGIPGTTVVIAGTGFTDATDVYFATGIGVGIASAGSGGPRPSVQGPIVSAVFTVDSDAQITTTVPSGCVTGPISVVTPTGSAKSTSSFVVESTQAPSITGFSPTSGGQSAQVWVYGQGFTGTTSLTFNGTPASFWLQGDTALRTTVPDGVTSGPIELLNTAGQATSSSPFTVIPPPSIQSFFPGSGTAGTPVTLTGSGFTGVESVDFGEKGALFTVVDTNTITATVPPGAATAPIRVRSIYGYAESQTPFQVLSSVAPSITAFSPTSGGPGARVMITGSWFTGTTSVKFNGIECWGFWIQNDSSLEATVPVGVTTGPITVTNTMGSDTSTTDFVVLPAPSVTGFSPASGGVGDSVVITGTGFTSVSLVRFGERWAGFTTSSDTTIVARVPSGAVTGPIEVGGVLSSQIFTVLSSAAPTITSFSPTSGSVGSYTRISGTNFTGVTDVSFNGTPSANFYVESDGSIAAYIPMNATSGPISVTNSIGTATSSQSFTIVAPPSITSFTPSSGSSGTTVVITGTGFLGVSSLRFGGDVEAIFIAESDTQITTTVPPGATSGPITLNDSIISPESFTVPATASPTVTSFSPTSGAPGARIDVYGTNLGSVTAVDFGGMAASFQLEDDTHLRVVVPFGAVTSLIHAINDLGTGTSSSPFTVVAPPTITSFSPMSGSAGTVVIVNGTGFTGANFTRVGIMGGVSATYDVVNDTRIDVTVPLGAVTGPITVETPMGSVSSSQDFTVVATSAPTISSFLPTSGGVGTLVRLSGAGFTGTTQVQVAGVSALFAGRSDGVLDVLVPASATTGPIVVTNAVGSTTSTTDFVVDSSQDMSVADVSPKAGPPGAIVTLAGTNLLGAEVGFPNVPENATVLSSTDTSLVFVVPASATQGFVVLTKTVNGATQVVAFAFTLYTPACTMTTVGVSCGLCSACNGSGECVAAALDDTGCGVIDCDDKDSTCGDFHDLTSGRCEAAGVCKAPNSLACTSLTAASAGTDCGVCASCDGSAACTADLTQDGDCAACEECAGAGSCALQPSGQDVKDDCLDLPCNTGACDGAGACGISPDSVPCDDANACTTGESCQSGVGCRSASRPSERAASSLVAVGLVAFALSRRVLRRRSPRPRPHRPGH